jgi:hypothetical protein
MVPSIGTWVSCAGGGDAVRREDVDDRLRRGEPDGAVGLEGVGRPMGGGDHGVEAEQGVVRRDRLDLPDV